MSENYGDKLAREVSLRIGASVANEAALSTLPARQKTNGRIILARTESTLWQVVGNGASGVLVPLGTGGGVGPLYWAEYTNPAAADAAGLKAATATTVAPQTILAAALIAGGKTALATYPRNVTFTTAGGTAADAPATATITGTDIDDAALTEVVNIAQTATIASGVKAFKTITSIVYSAADGTDATVAIGFGAVFGLPKKAKVRGGIVAVVQEIANGALATNGTFVIPATGLPYGTYAPNSAPDGSKDYAVLYERDLS